MCIRILANITESMKYRQLNSCKMYTCTLYKYKSEQTRLMGWHCPNLLVTSKCFLKSNTIKGILDESHAQMYVETKIHGSSVNMTHDYILSVSITCVHRFNWTFMIFYGYYFFACEVNNCKLHVYEYLKKYSVQEIIMYFFTGNLHSGRQNYTYMHGLAPIFPPAQNTTSLLDSHFPKISTIFLVFGQGPLMMNTDSHTLISIHVHYCVGWESDPNKLQLVPILKMDTTSFQLQLFRVVS